MNKPIILVIGALGQIGTELTATLRACHGDRNVIAADLCPVDPGIGNYMHLDVMDSIKLQKAVKDNKVTQIYLLAAILSAKSEKDINAAWNLNMQSLISVLNIARDQKLEKVFWPSSIAVFGPCSPKFNCPQNTRMQPATIYGISKRAGEYWCNYYFQKYGVDIRSIRFPGLISHAAMPGGRTTDYAVEIFHQALKHGKYNCFLDESTVLPMLYMKDATRAVLELMRAPAERLTIRSSYNLAGMSFAPCDLAAEIKKHIPHFEVGYEPDYRQAIANGWPASINDAQAQDDWGWKPSYNLASMTTGMLDDLSPIKYPCVGALKPYPDFQTEDVAQV
jgi:nucleoside-diphosphate-sugar epimerase